jgi:hypothetical protein
MTLRLVPRRSQVRSAADAEPSVYRKSGGGRLVDRQNGPRFHGGALSVGFQFKLSQELVQSKAM